MSWLFNGFCTWVVLTVFHKLSLSLLQSCVVSWYCIVTIFDYGDHKSMHEKSGKPVEWLRALDNITSFSIMWFISGVCRYGSLTHTDFYTPLDSRCVVPSCGTNCSHEQQLQTNSFNLALHITCSAPSNHGTSVMSGKCLPSVHRIMFFTCFNYTLLCEWQAQEELCWTCLLRLCSHDMIATPNLSHTHAPSTASWKEWPHAAAKSHWTHFTKS